jgi:hypothetical protein
MDMTILRTCLVGLLAVTAPLALGGAGCATGSGAKSSAPVELNGSKWKMIVSGGRMDGRIIEFKKRGPGYMAFLVEKGHRLRDVTGLDMGETWVFSIKPKGVNEYEGVYRDISPDGSMSEKEVVVFIDGDNLNWNLETATWERQK